MIGMIFYCVALEWFKAKNLNVFEWTCRTADFSPVLNLWQDMASADLGQIWQSLSSFVKKGGQQYLDPVAKRSLYQVLTLELDTYAAT